MASSKIYRRFLKGRQKATTRAAGAAQAALNGVQKTLLAVADSLDGVPAPGLQGSIRGILFVLDNIDRAGQNLQDFLSLEEHLKSCQDIFATYKSASLPAAVREALQTLADDIRSTTEIINRVVDRCRARRIWESSEDAQLLVGQVRQINSALTRFQAAIATFTAVQTSESLAIDRQILVDKLLNVSGAYYNSRERAHVVPCLENTRAAVLHRIKDWIFDPQSPPIFWLHGMAGTGKSTIAQTVSELCAKDNILAGHFFFARDKRLRQTADGLLTTIIHQLSSFELRVIPHVAGALLKDASIVGSHVSYKFPQLLVQPLLQLRSNVPALLFPMVVVIDALDECQFSLQVTQILRLLLRNDLCLRPRPTLKFLLTTRPEHRIRKEFDATPVDPARGFLAYDIAQDNVHDDIALYLRKGFKEIQVKRQECFRSRNVPWPEKYVMQKLIRKSSGLFIYAATILKFVGDKRQHPVQQLKLVSSITVKTAQPEAYSELDSLYRQIIIQDPNLDRVHILLGAITLLFDPLSSLQLEILLELEEGDALTTLQWLQSILVIPSDEDEPITLFHPSFNDFLTTKERSEELYLDPALQHGRLAQACIKVMRIGWPSWWSPSPSSAAHTNLLEYASRRWAYHLARANLDQSALVNDVLDFLNTFGPPWLESFLRLGQLNEAVAAISEVFRSGILQDRDDLCGHLCDEIVSFAAVVSSDFQYAREVPPLYTAESLCELAVGFNSENPYYNYHLGVIRRKVHQWYSLSLSLAKAIGSHEVSLRTLPDNHVDRPMFLIAFATTRRLMYVYQRQPENIEHAISLINEALSLISDDDPNKSVAFNGLGLALAAKYDRMRREEDLVSAVEAFRRTLTLPTVHPSATPVFLQNLEVALRKFPGIDQVAEADELLNKVSEHACATPSIAFQAAYNRAIYQRNLRSQSPLEAYFHALALSRRIFWAAFREDKARKLLKLVEACALEAVMTALDETKLWAALECFEAASTTFWVEGLNVGSPFFPLTPPLLRAIEISKILEVESTNEPRGFLAADRHKELPDVSSLVEELDSITDSIPRRDFSGQQMRQMFSDLKGVPTNGRLVVLTMALGRCSALIVTGFSSSSPNVFHLPLHAPVDQLTSLAAKSKECWNEGLGHSVGKQVLQQIWDLIAGPIVGALKLEPSNDPPRTWWCISTPLTDLPIHAAGDYNSVPTRNLTDYMISSYLPTITSLKRLTEANPPKSASGDTLLALTPFETSILEPVLSKEVDELKHIMPEDHLTVMGKESVPIPYFLNKLRSFTGVYIPVRIDHRNDNPAAYRFALPGDLYLTLSELSTQSTLPRFAYLSTYPFVAALPVGPVTCRTGYDLLNVGFTSVIARQSPFSGTDPGIMTRTFHTELAQLDPLINFSLAHKALHLAIVKLRECSADPNLWVRFIHIGV